MTSKKLVKKSLVKISIILTLIFVLTSIPTSIYANTINRPAIDDVNTDSAWPPDRGYTSLDADNFMDTDGTNTYKINYVGCNLPDYTYEYAAIKFNLTGISGTINTASFKFYIVGIINDPVVNIISPDSDDPWAEEATGFSSFPVFTVGNYISEDGVSYSNRPVTEQWNNFIVTDYIQSRIDAGATDVTFILTGKVNDDYNEFTFCSVNDGGSNIPQLDVEYTPDTTKPVLADVSPLLLKTGTEISATSNENGKLYLVPKATYANKAALDAVESGRKKIATAAANIAKDVDIIGLEDGIYIMYAVDYAGNISLPSGDITIDNTAPILGPVSPTTLKAGTSISASSNESGTLYLVPKAVYGDKTALDEVGAGIKKTVAATAGDIKTITTDGLAEGTYQIYAVDGVANISIASGDITIDNTPPSAPSVTGITDDTGTSASDGITSDNTLTINGTAEVNSTVEVFKNGVSIGTATTNGSGNWTFDYRATPLDEGSYNFTATATDTAGNTSVTSLVFAVTVDTVPPLAPSLPDLTEASDTGESDTDNITSVTTPVFTGTAEVNSTVELINDGTTSIGTTMADSIGNWSFTAGSLAGGSYTITAKATDIAGNTSGASPSLSITIDTTAPSVSSINRQTPAEEITNSASVTYRVTFNEAVTGVDVGDFILTKTNAADGTITSVSATSGTSIDVTVDTETGDGTLRLDLNNTGTGITDIAGNAISGGFTGGQTYTVDKTSPSAITISGQNSIPAGGHLTLTAVGGPLSDASWNSIRDQIRANTETGLNWITGTAADDLTISPAGDGATAALNNESANTATITADFVITAGNVVDRAGNTAASNIIIDSYLSPAHITGVSSTTANGAYKAGDIITITVTFDTSVDVEVTGGIPVLHLDTGAIDRDALYVSGTGTAVLTFNYTVQAGDMSSDLEYINSNSLELNGGTIKNKDKMLNADLALPSVGSSGSLGDSKEIVVDTAVPIVSAVSPAILKTGTNLNATSNEAGTLYLVPKAVYADKAALDSVAAGSKKTATATASNLISIATDGLGEGTYQVYAADEAGNVSNASGDIQIDNTAPVLSGVLPVLLKSGTNISAASNENGTLYLVPKAVYADKADLEAVVAANKKTAAATAGDTKAIATNGLNSGTYQVYAVDEAGNLSLASGDIIVDDIAPVLSGISPAALKTGTNVNATSNENGTLYLVPKAAYADKAALDSVDAGSKKTTTATAGDEKTIATNGLGEGTYQVYAVDELGNMSVASEDIMIDNTAPVVAITPTDGAIEVSAGSNITIGFNEAVRKLDGTAVENADLAALIALKKTNASGESVAFTATVNLEKTQITINPADNLESNQIYYVAIKDLKDAAGNAISMISATFTAETVLAADLTNVELSGSPSGFTFAGNTYSYSGVMVANAVGSITVTPTGAGIITVNGNAVTSGQASGSIALTPGVAKTITIEVSQSGKTSKTYTITVTREVAAQVTPVFNPTAGAITFGSTVAITSAEAEHIYYTTDGTNPAAAVVGSTHEYTGPITVNSEITIKAIATREHYNDSQIASASYTQAAANDLTNVELSGSPSGFTFAAGTYSYPGVTVGNAVDSITVTPTGAGTITVNGNAVTSGLASESIALTPGVAKTIIIEVTESGKTSKTYTITVTRAMAVQVTPSFSPAAGDIAFGSTVSITSTGADHIYYTTDGTNPAAAVGGSTQEYTGPITVNSAITIKAMATRDHYNNSAIASASYTQTAAANLTGIELSGSPSGFTFAESTYSYPGVTVANAVDSITVTPTGAGTITVNGSPVASGLASGSIALTPGVAKTITIEVTEPGKASKTYTIIVTRGTAAQAAPVFSPAAGDIAFGSTVSITSTGADHIYYTTDGTNPAAAVGGSTQEYTGPITVNSAITIKAMATRDHYNNSAIASASYTQTAAANLTGIELSGSPSGFTFAAGTYSYPGVTVGNAVDSITVTPTGAGTIKVNGNAVASGLASGSIALTPGVVKTITIEVTEPGKASKTYTITVTRGMAAQAVPSFSPAAGAITFGSTVTITSAGAEHIYYTTDGTNPAAAVGGSTQEYTGPIPVNSAITIKAIATREHYNNSEIASASYTQAAAANLTGIELSGSPSGFTFAAGTYSYPGVTVGNAVDSITVTPSGAGAITVNGSPVTSGLASGSIALTPGVAKTITIEVTEPGKASKTYTITVTRGTAAQAAPSFSPAAGAIAFGSTVTITSAGAAHIYYTTDGTNPAAAVGGSTQEYTGPIIVNSAIAIKAIATREHYNNSEIASASYTMADAEAPTVAITPANGATGVEIGSNIIIDFSEAVIKLNNTAVENGDLVSLIVLKKTNASGEDVAFTATINAEKTRITINPGSNLEAGQTYYIAISAGLKDGAGNAVGAASASFTTAAPGTLEFANATESVSEGTASKVLTVNRTGGSNGAVSVAYSVTGGTATAGVDYILSAGVLNFADGETSKTITVNISEDEEIEGDETIVVTLGTTTGGAVLGINRTVTLTIIDNDTAAPGTLEFANATESVSEGTASKVLTVNRTGGSNGAVSVAYSVTGGTATAGVDYILSAGVLNFADGETSKTITVNISEDEEIEGNETIIVTLGTTTGGAVLGINRAVTLTITDNDTAVPGTLEFANATESVSEGTASKVLTVNRTGGSNGAVSVAYSVTGGTATAGVDYTLTAGVLNFADGETSKTITVNISEDEEIEGDETIVVTLGATTGGAVLGTNRAVTLTITDNDTAAPGTLEFANATESVSEGTASKVLTVNRTGGSNGAVSVAYSVTGGTATAGVDYILSAGVLNFADGETSKTITVNISEDEEIEGNETIIVTLGTTTGGAVLGINRAVTLTITDSQTAAYKVEHYWQKTDGSGYEWQETEDLTGIAGEVVTAAARTYTGFTENSTYAGRVATGTVRADGSLVLKLYYDRSLYTVTFKNWNNTEIGRQTVKYGDKATVPAEPVRTGFTFAGWYKNAGLTIPWNFTRDTVTANTSIYAKWNAVYELTVPSFSINSQSIMNGSTRQISLEASGSRLLISGVEQTAEITYSYTEVADEDNLASLTGNILTLTPPESSVGKTVKIKASASWIGGGSSITASRIVSFTVSNAGNPPCTCVVTVPVFSVSDQTIPYNTENKVVNLSASGSKIAGDCQIAEHKASRISYSYQIISGGVDSNDRSIASISSGQMTLNPTIAGTYTIMVRATAEANGKTAGKTVSFTVTKEPAPLEEECTCTLTAPGLTGGSITIQSGAGSAVLDLSTRLNPGLLQGDCPVEGHSGAPVYHIYAIKSGSGYNTAGAVLNGRVLTVTRSGSVTVVVNATANGKISESAETTYTVSDADVNNVETLITALPGSGSTDDDIYNASDEILNAKAAFENLLPAKKEQVNKEKRNKLDALIVRLGLVQTAVDASRAGGTAVTVSGLETSIDTSGDLNAGSNVNITLTVQAEENITESDNIAADSNIILESAGNGQNLSSAFDVSLIKTVTDITGSTYTENVAEADAPVYVTMEVPQSMRGGTEYRIYHVHTLADGSKALETIEAVYNAGPPPTISFWISKFSTIKIAYTPAPPDTDNNHTPSPSIPVSTSEAASILVGGKAADVGTVVSNQTDNRRTSRVIIDGKKLEEKLAGENNGAAITVVFHTDADDRVLEMTGETVKNLADKQAIIEVKAGTATYTLPAQSIGMNEISKQLGSQVKLQDIKVQIKIAAPADSIVKAVENYAKQKALTMAVPPIEFDVTYTYGDKTAKINSFNNYVTGTVAVPDGVDPKKITTGVFVEQNGTISHVPTRILVVNGKYYAEINSISGGVYSVIWNPKTFKDAEGHWAQAAINDMGSRLVISGVGGDRFSPDRSISRAEFASIIVTALGLKRVGAGTDIYSDVVKKDWFYDAVGIAYAYGIVQGYPDGKFHPEKEITREEAMVMLNKAMKIVKLDTNVSEKEVSQLLGKFTDGNKAGSWSEKAVASCLKNDVFTGYQGKLNLKRSITRAETATTVRKILRQANLIN